MAREGGHLMSKRGPVDVGSRPNAIDSAPAPAGPVPTAYLIDARMFQMAIDQLNSLPTELDRPDDDYRQYPNCISSSSCPDIDR